MPRQDPVEKFKRNMDFEIAVLNNIEAITRDAYQATRHLPSHEVMEIADIAEKKLKYLKKYQDGTKKVSSKNARILFKACIEKKK